MKETQIQWADDTVNPVMGCNGCELWPSPAELVRTLKDVLGQLPADECGKLEQIDELAKEWADAPLKDCLHGIVAALVPDTERQKETIRKVRSTFKCYAGQLSMNRGGIVKGYPRHFDRPEIFPGRVEKSSRSKDLRGLPRPEKPWLDGQPRMIFISDMGDALSRSISFEDLLEEIVLPVEAEAGRRHVWLWLSKRPNRMAEFAQWLQNFGGHWPTNLVAMTSVTSSKTVGRVQQLRKVSAMARGLSVEPLFEPVQLPLEGIDWVIVGGESGAKATPFHLEWARDIQRQCSEARVAFFCKQLGAKPVEAGCPLRLKNGHGGDWSEWPVDLRVREVPEKFKQLVGK